MCKSVRCNKARIVCWTRWLYLQSFLTKIAIYLNMDPVTPSANRHSLNVTARLIPRLRRLECHLLRQVAPSSMAATLQAGWFCDRGCGRGCRPDIPPKKHCLKNRQSHSITLMILSSHLVLLKEHVPLTKPLQYSKTKTRLLFEPLDIEDIDHNLKNHIIATKTTLYTFAHFGNHICFWAMTSISMKQLRQQTAPHLILHL